MNLLQNLFTPENFTDIFILKFGLYLSLLFTFPFLSLLIGSLLFSLLHVNKSRIYNNSEYFNFAKYSIELLVNKMWMRIIFGVIPFFGFAFFYSQLYTTQINAPENLLFAFLLFFAGLCLSVIFKNSFKLKRNSDGTKKNPFTKSGWFALLLLLSASYIVISYLQSALVTNITEKASIFGIMFSTTSILMYLLFLSISFSLTSALVIVRLNRRVINKYSFYDYGLEFSAKTGILFTFIQPLIYVLFVVSVSSYALSFSFFFTSLLTLLIMLLINIRFYISYRKQCLKNTSIVFLFMLLFSLLIYNNQLTSEKVKNIEDVNHGKVFNIFS